jgi:hypothetical protein
MGRPKHKPVLLTAWRFENSSKYEIFYFITQHIICLIIFTIGLRMRMKNNDITPTTFSITQYTTSIH